MKEVVAKALATIAAQAYERHPGPSAVEIRPGVFKVPGSPHPFDALVCQDCRRPEPLHFTVHNAIWAQAGLTTGVICPACLEARIGRPLTLHDFKACPANELLFYGASLALTSGDPQ